MTTIKEVAKLAGVSTATVSRVINNNNNVNADTKKRVEDAVHRLNYHPNDVARTLYKGRSKIIALFVPDIMNPYYPELARAVEDVTNHQGYTFVLCNTDDDSLKEQAYRDALRQKNVDGIIIVSSTITETEASNMTTPTVLLDRKIAVNMGSVTVNNRAGAREATTFLKSIGCKRIAHISGPEHDNNAISRRNGYLDEMRNEKWFRSDYIISGQYSFDAGMSVTRELLTTRPEIDGLFVGNDLMGVAALKAAQELGLKVPDGLSVVGFDGIALGKTATPSLTTMAQPIYEMGVCAANMLLDQIDKGTTKTYHEEFPVQLIERESTRKRG